MAEKTFAMIKPDAVKARNVGKIIDMIEQNGFTIIRMEKRRLTKQQAEQFYAVHKEKQFFILSILLILSSIGARISFAWGSQSYFFSLLALLLPLVGVLFRTKRSVGIVGGYFGLKALLGLFPFTLGLPSLCAAASWSAHTTNTKSAGLQKLLLE